ncbi:MAG: hypothetical protein HC808_11630 [Candidatus Competibacteraceae bacterium]|nr:hypothetical protein [Candidatus Competibacteraceae bacterium]
MPTTINDIKSIRIPSLPKRYFEDLLSIAGDALAIHPPDYIRSIFGPIRDWIPPHDGYSEFSIIDLWRLRRTIKYLVNTIIPSLPFNPPPFGPPILNNIFWHPTVILQRPDHNGNYTTFPDESWFFINGIMTNDSLAQLNAAYLSYLFHRPLTLIQNSTDSFFVDLLQCAIGKQWGLMTEPAIKAFPPIHQALKDPSKQRVVVVAHSQGTIIMSNVLKWLQSKVAIDIKQAQLLPVIKDILKSNVVAVEPEQYYAPASPVFVYPDQDKLDLNDFETLTVEELAKLEIYLFANCANEMKYSAPAVNGQAPLPWIENFANENDIVARLGMLAPHPEKRGIKIAGPNYVHKGAWGHFLNVHYLFDIQHHQKQGRKQGGAGNAKPYVLGNPDDSPVSQTPRLFDYLNGGVPD